MSPILRGKGRYTRHWRSPRAEVRKLIEACRIAPFNKVGCGTSLLIPIPGNGEIIRSINAWLLRKTKGGNSLWLTDLRSGSSTAFLSQGDSSRVADCEEIGLGSSLASGRWTLSRDGEGRCE